MQQVAMLRELVEGRPATVELGETKILLLRQGDVVRGFGAACPHAGAPLDQGAVCQGRLICPWHKAMFDITDGALLEPPALEGLRRYPVAVEGDRVLASPVPIEPSSRTGSPDDRTMVIVGAGAAGAAGAAFLREFGFTGRIVLVGREPGEAFDRTALSKFVLEGDMAPQEVPPLHPDGFHAAHGIERLHDSVLAIDPVARTLTLSGGARLSYSAALLAPGGIPRPLDVPGRDRPGVHVLRSRADASAILAELRDRPRVVIVGGGFIGLEAASALRKQQIPVEVILSQEIPFEPILGTEIGTMLRRLHETNGVVFRTGAAVIAIEGDGADGRVQAVLLEDGRRIEAELVLAGVGVRPATEFAAALGLAEDGGLDTDRGLRVCDGIYAAGDVARFPFGDDDGARIRVEHWRVAQQHARIAARNMLGGDARFEQPPFFWTYHYGKRIEVHGHPSGFDRVEIDGDLDAPAFVARQFRDGALVGLIGCERDTELAELALQLPACP